MLIINLWLGRFGWTRGWQTGSSSIYIHSGSVYAKFCSYLIISLFHKSSNEHTSPCLGIAVPWLPGSVWTTYPYQRHRGSVGWTPIAFNKKNNKLTICSDHCEGSSHHLIDGACTGCKALPESQKYCDFVQHAVAAPVHTQWEYLTSDQLSSLLSKSNQNCRQLQNQVKNSLNNFWTLYW